MTMIRLRRRLLWILCGSLHVTACGYPALSPVVGSDANGDTPASDTAAPPDVSGASLPLHVLASSVPQSAPDLAIPHNNGAISVIDTDALSIGGQFNPSFVRQGDYVILFTGKLDLEGETQIRGKAPLIISASGEVRVVARIRANAVGTTSGPGASAVGIGNQAWPWAAVWALICDSIRVVQSPCSSQLYAVSDSAS